MRTSFHHQLEAQPPNLPVCRTGEPQYPIYRRQSGEYKAHRKRLPGGATHGNNSYRLDHSLTSAIRTLHPC